MNKIINLLINNWTKGVDTYTHNGSTWLIFTEQKSWVIELTESKTLWYNYNFFKELFSLTSMDVVENQHYITKWVEDNVINKELTYVTLFRDARDRKQQFEDTLENGVKETISTTRRTLLGVDDVIQNGVKDTLDLKDDYPLEVDEVIQDGVKETRLGMNITEGEVDDIIQDGVKHTEIGWHQCNNIDDTIKYGVKETLFNQGHKRLTVKNIIENGVRHALNTEYMPTSMVEDIIQSGVKETLRASYLNVDNVIQDGVKETKTPGKDGDIMSTVEWMLENNSTSYPKMIDDVIENGEKINGTYVGGKKQKENIESVIGYGTKNPSV